MARSFDDFIDIMDIKKAFFETPKYSEFLSAVGKNDMQTSIYALLELCVGLNIDALEEYHNWLHKDESD